MYAVAVQHELIAQHFLIGGDFGPENRPHSHRYRIEWRLKGRELDRYGFLVDIDRISSDLDEVLDKFRDKMLNHLPAFAGLNPSIENLARVLWEELAQRLDAETPLQAEVTIWESDSAWTSYTAAPCASG